MRTTNLSAFYHQLKSIPYVQKFLSQCYQKGNFNEYEKLSFQNADRFIYYLEHAETYLTQAKKASISIQPVLLFYGLTQLIKTCLITKRPHYPENTSLLAHGVSTRKRKKQSYRFLQDEVKIQQKGLFPYFTSHLYSIQQLPVDKFSMEHLFKKIPEMDDLYAIQHKEEQYIRIGPVDEKILRIPLKLIYDWHLSERRFVEKLQSFLPPIKEWKLDQKNLMIYLERELLPFESNLITTDIECEHLLLHKNRFLFHPFHEGMAHFLLLYNLSMICRYETEWWGELLHSFSNNDYPYILHFLNITAKKIPIMLGFFLLNQT
ncbi:YaaC-like Protein [Salinibacillus kushneri]|uniref:YaaC-like Protein n=1 Tax=Salinibacillus kushneri TaxID=237682 RepID=A0A1I0C4V5_9BACI|nr:YaaC family protein [Salinibacillus kushneri]SET14481.1 YaaC-like Protein [Salinibacillus kushneri]